MSQSSPERLLAVGDIHGCLDLLQQLMQQVRPGSGDQLVFLGDYIDRGADSCGVVEFLLHLRKEFPQTVFLRGNHEQMLLDFLAGSDQLSFLLNGGTATLESYERRTGSPPRIPSEHLIFFNNLQLSYIRGDFIFVHAGLRPGVPIERQDDSDLLWIRGEFINSDFDWGKTVIFGHSPQPDVLEKPNMIGLDTGAVYGNRLSCYDALSGRLWQVSPDGGGAPA